MLKLKYHVFMIKLSMEKSILDVIRDNCPMTATQLMSLFDSKKGFPTPARLQQIIAVLVKEYGFTYIRGVLFYDCYEELERITVGTRMAKYYNLAYGQKRTCDLGQYSPRLRFIQRFKSTPDDFPELKVFGTCHDYMCAIKNTTVLYNYLIK